MRELDDLNFGAYLEKVVHNVKAPVELYPEAMKTSESMLSHVVDCLNHPDGAVASSKMLMFAHSSWRGAVVLAVAGAGAHVSPVLRQSLEAAMYGYLFRFDPKFLELWMKRETSKTARGKFRNHWSPRTKKLLDQRNPNLKDRVYKRLDDLISFGGHPNFLSVEPGFEVDELDADGNYQMSFSYLGNNEQRTLTFVHAAMVADLIASLFVEIFPDRARFMGLDSHLQQLKFDTSSLLSEYRAMLKAK